MSEMRFNPITLDWVIMAPDRALKPNDFLRDKNKERPPRPQHRADCPFCPGNEAMAMPEVCSTSAPDGSWAVRVLPNKFSAFIQAENLDPRTHGVYRSMAAAGVHEVVVEHPRHDFTLVDMELSHLAEVLRMYRERHRTLREHPHVKNIVIFKNQGERAGTSLEHPHSQITAAPVVSSQVFARLEEARRYSESHAACLYCTVMRQEMESGERILECSTSFAAFHPYASLSPYHTWIFPRAHAASFDSINDDDILELARVLRRVLRRLQLGAGNPDYNFTLRSAPVGDESSPCYHWYLAIVPRISYLAGFELGSGIYINSLRPERCAEIMRAVPLEGE
jgi:UDPglucose--hexose-1-phosphate uridylyltransferase